LWFLRLNANLLNLNASVTVQPLQQSLSKVKNDSSSRLSGSVFFFKELKNSFDLEKRFVKLKVG
jgi:hypothetical protein